MQKGALRALLVVRVREVRGVCQGASGGLVVVNLGSVNVLYDLEMELTIFLGHKSIKWYCKL